MKQIAPVSVWNNGQEKTASILIASIVSDNLESSCSFYYQLCEEGEEGAVGEVLAQGNVALSGEDYLAWDGSNEAAYAYVAGELNLTIVVAEVPSAE